MLQGSEMDQNQPILLCLHSSFVPETSLEQNHGAGPKSMEIYEDYIPERIKFWENDVKQDSKKAKKLRVTKKQITSLTHRYEDISPSRNGITILVTFVTTCPKKPQLLNPKSQEFVFLCVLILKRSSYTPLTPLIYVAPNVGCVISSFLIASHFFHFQLFNPVIFTLRISFSDINDLYAENLSFLLLNK